MWSTRYAKFSQAFFDEYYIGYYYLLRWPERMAEQPEVGFASLMWMYMTP